jgi:hypothetical protein
MNCLKRNLGIVGAVVAVSLLAGCLLSGTFIFSYMLVENEDLIYNGDFYYASVDWTDDNDWKDHKDNIKDIDLVGFELWITNETGTADTFTVYVVDLQSSLDGSSTRSEVDSLATLAVNDLPIAASGQTHITYGQSFKYLDNVETLKNLTEAGEFKLFAFMTSPSANLTVDSVRVIVTLTVGT